MSHRKSLKKTIVQHKYPYREMPSFANDIDNINNKIDNVNEINKDHEERFKTLENIEMMTLKTNFLWPLVVFCLASPVIAFFLSHYGESLFSLIMYFMSFFTCVCVLSFCLQLSSPRNKW